MYKVCSWHSSSPNQSQKSISVPVKNASTCTYTAAYTCVQMPYSSTWLYTSSSTITGKARNVHTSRRCNASGNVASSCGGRREGFSLACISHDSRSSFVLSHCQWRWMTRVHGELVRVVLSLHLRHLQRSNYKAWALVCCITSYFTSLQLVNKQVLMLCDYSLFFACTLDHTSLQYTSEQSACPCFVISYSLPTDLCVLLSACGPKNIVPGNVL